MQNQHPRTLEASATTFTSDDPSYDGKFAGLYDLGETLGSGHFAVVKFATHVYTGANVAVKVVDKRKLDEVSKAHLYQEVRCMKLVQHPHVVRLYEVIETHTKLYLVLELADGGDLYDYIMKHDGGLDEQLARKYFRQLLRAITYCHELHVVHRDLKPENVVFFEKIGIVKLTDFGFSNKFLPGEKLETFCGSLAYSAPEILLGDSYDAPPVDIWSLGVILYMLVCGQAPFEKANDSETLTMIMDCKYNVPPKISHSCRKLIAAMLVRDPKKRATVEEIASDDWVKEVPESDNTGYVPLISYKQLSEEDHASIIKRMVNGKIASKEDILQALDMDKYNYITATYFLLAEIRLHYRKEPLPPRRNNNGGVRRAQVPDKKAKPLEGGKQIVVPINIVCAPEPIQNEIKTDKRTRKCSIVREEDEEESSHELLCDGNELKVSSIRKESISDGRLNRSVKKNCSNVSVVGSRSNSDTVTDMEKQSKMFVSVDATLAQKLNQIEEDTANEEIKEVPQPSASLKKSFEMQDTLRGLKELEIGKFKHISGKNPVLTHRRHTKLNKIRTPSCSSSEASDDDTKSRNKKKMHKLVGDNPTRFRMHRRDSHDDSSDSQDQGFPTAGQHGGNALISTSSVNNKKEGQNQQNKTESDTHNKSSHTHSHQDHSYKHKNKQPKDNLEKQNSAVEKNLNQNVRRRRIRESQSLDRITEAQEYEMRHQHYHHQRLSYSETERYTYEQRNSLFNLHTFPEAKEEDCDDNEPCSYGGGENSSKFANQAELIRNSLNNLKIHVGNKSADGSSVCGHGSGCDDSTTNSNASSLKSSHTHSSASSIYKLNSIEEIDLILKERTLTKTIQATSSRCFVTIRKIRKLGKYFPVVNFS